MLKFLCAFVLCSCALTSADTCDSKLQQVCGNEIKEGKQACDKCGRQHESDLAAAGCTVAEVEQLCDGSTDACDSKLQQVCGNEIKEGEQACDRCGRQHESVLKAAGCTVAEVGKLCQGGHPPRPKGGNDLKKVLLDNSNEKTAIGGRCLDGSPAGYYYGAPSGNGIHKWSIYLKGGGACYTEESCKKRAVMKNGLGM